MLGLILEFKVAEDKDWKTRLKTLCNNTYSPEKKVIWCQEELKLPKNVRLP